MKKVIFWDLLGTLGGDAKTLISDFTFFEEAIPALKRAETLGFLNIVVTNQSHISRGRMTLYEYEKGIERLKKELDSKEATINAFYTCPHQRKEKCTCKKPEPLLIYQAQNDFDIDLSLSYVVGDTVKNDIGLAQRCNIKGILVLTGNGPDTIDKKDLEYEPFIVAKDVLDAVIKIENRL